MTRQRTGFQQTQYQWGPLLGRVRIRRGYLFVLLGRQRQGKALGADPLPLINYQVELFLYPYFLAILLLP